MSKIDKKIQEHKNELLIIEEEIKQIKADFDKENASGKKTQALQSMQKIMVLKDKSLFHRSAILVLEDVKNDP